MSRHRAWCFTINNYTQKDLDTIQSLNAQYIIAGREVGASGTPHVQGYVYFNNAKSLKAVSKLLQRAHLSVAYGSPSDNFNYCSKEDLHPYIRGELPHQGQRSDIDQLKHDLDTMPLTTVADLHFRDFLKFGNMIKSYKHIKTVDRTTAPRVEWVYGPTGCGKTRYATSITPLSFYIKDGTQWWDGYEQQQTIIIDDFDGKWPFRDLLRLLDRYPYQGQYKGGYVKINSPYIIITADRAPQTRMTTLTENEFAQLARRIDAVIALDDNVLQT